MSSEGTLLLVAVLTLIISALTFFRPALRLMWQHWLRYRWYRTVVALREDQTQPRVSSV